MPLFTRVEKTNRNAVIGSDGEVCVVYLQVLGGQQKAVEGSLQHVVNEVTHQKAAFESV